ncbi:MAG: cyclase family protein [Acidobacteriota bacterium]
MRVLDLSHRIEPDMPMFPGDLPPEFQAVATVERDGYAARRVGLHSHTGTHVDAPAHLLMEGGTLDEMDPGRFVGSARVVRVPAGKTSAIGLSELQRLAGDLAGLSFLLLDTGWAGCWGTPGYREGFPCLEPEAARWLAASGLSGVGVDGPSFDPVGSEGLPTHRILLEAGKLLVENLAGVDLLPASPFLFVCLPLPLARAEGAPVRAVAIL